MTYLLDTSELAWVDVGAPPDIYIEVHELGRGVRERLSFFFGGPASLTSKKEEWKSSCSLRVT